MKSEVVKDFKTKHMLPFEAAPYEMNIDPDNEWIRFRVGTCMGLWCFDDENLKILAVENDKPGNGHFEDVLQWFEKSANEHKKPLKFLAMMNPAFEKHLVEKRGFIKVGDDVVKELKIDNSKEEYVPFGKEWEKEMMRWTKKDLIKSMLIPALENIIILEKGTKCPECDSKYISYTEHEHYECSSCDFIWINY